MELLQDPGETIGLMEPMLISGSARSRTRLTGLAIEFTARSTGFRASLPAGVMMSLANLVRAMDN